MKLEFNSQGIIAKRNMADLGEYGEFEASFVKFDMEQPDRFEAVGKLYTMPKHADETLVLKDVTLEVDIDVLHSDPISEKPTAEEVFNKAWVRWGCYDIPEEWEY